MPEGRALLLRVIIAAVTTAGLFAFLPWRDAHIRTTPMLAVAFDHADHKNVGCVDCHHNYIDDTGSDLCYACHKNHEDIATQTQQMFHDFCRDCHVDLAREDKEHGPLRICTDCHHKPGSDFALDSM